MALNAEPANRSWLINYAAVIGVTGAAGVAILALMLLDEHVSLAIIFGVGAVALAWVTAICDVQGIHAVWRMLAQIVMLGAMMYFLYDRGDIYVPQAVIMSLGAILIMNPLSFASEAAENSEQARLVPLIGLLNSVYFCYVAWELPNPGVFQLSIFLGVLSLVLIIAPLPHMGVVLGSFAWAVGAYAWLGNASPAMVLAPVTLVMLDVIWTLIRRLVTKDGREEMPTRGSFWTKLNAWTLPAEDMVTQRLGSLEPQPRHLLDLLRRPTERDRGLRGVAVPPRRPLHHDRPSRLHRRLRDRGPIRHQRPTAPRRQGRGVRLGPISQRSDMQVAASTTPVAASQAGRAPSWREPQVAPLLPSAQLLGASVHRRRFQRSTRHDRHEQR